MIFDQSISNLRKIELQLMQWRFNPFTRSRIMLLQSAPYKKKGNSVQYISDLMTLKATFQQARRSFTKEWPKKHQIKRKETIDHRWSLAIAQCRRWVIESPSLYSYNTNKQWRSLFWKKKKEKSVARILPHASVQVKKAAFLGKSPNGLPTKIHPIASTKGR